MTSCHWATGNWLVSLFPENLDSYLSALLKKRQKGGGGEDQEQQETAPDQRTGAPPGRRSELEGYGRADRAGMRQLIESKAAAH